MRTSVTGPIGFGLPSGSPPRHVVLVFPPTHPFTPLTIEVAVVMLFVCGVADLCAVACLVCSLGSFFWKQANRQTNNSGMVDKTFVWHYSQWFSDGRNQGAVVLGAAAQGLDARTQNRYVFDDAFWLVKSKCSSCIFYQSQTFCVSLHKMQHNSNQL